MPGHRCVTGLAVKCTLGEDLKECSFTWYCEGVQPGGGGRSLQCPSLPSCFCQQKWWGIDPPPDSTCPRKDMGRQRKGVKFPTTLTAGKLGEFEAPSPTLIVLPYRAKFFRWDPPVHVWLQAWSSIHDPGICWAYHVVMPFKLNYTILSLVDLEVTLVYLEGCNSASDGTANGTHQNVSLFHFLVRGTPMNQEKWISINFCKKTSCFIAKVRGMPSSQIGF